MIASKAALEPVHEVSVVAHKNGLRADQYFCVEGTLTEAADWSQVFHLKMEAAIIYICGQSMPAGQCHFLYGAFNSTN